MDLRDRLTVALKDTYWTARGLGAGGMSSVFVAKHLVASHIHYTVDHCKQVHTMLADLADLDSAAFQQSLLN